MSRSRRRPSSSPAGPRRREGRRLPGADTTPPPPRRRGTTCGSAPAARSARSTFRWAVWERVRESSCSPCRPPTSTSATAPTVERRLRHDPLTEGAGVMCSASAMPIEQGRLMETNCTSGGSPTRVGLRPSQRIPMRMGSAPTIPKRPMTSVCAGQPMYGAPRRNRTADPILTMELPGTAVRTAISPARARPSGSKFIGSLAAKLCAHFSRHGRIVAGAGHHPVRDRRLSHFLQWTRGRDRPRVTRRPPGTPVPASRRPGTAPSRAGAARYARPGQRRRVEEG
jgi:hypothetical protein